jgi:GT2 family glycosyltransferase
MISIILINWNGLKWLSKCISSLQNQTYKNIEIILVDNASTDGSIEFVESKFPKIKIIKNKQNLGFSKGNNIGISKAKGEFILLMNNDTWVEKNFLDKLIIFYKENSYDVVAPREAAYDGEKQKPYVTKIDLSGHPVCLYSEKYTEIKSFYLSGVYYSQKNYI